VIRYVIQSRSINNDGARGILPPGVDAEHPEKHEHVERDGQRDQGEDHPAVGANSKESRVVDAVVDLQLFGSTRENLVGRLGARRELGKLGGVGLWLLLLPW
jgi:hypothetical protein